MIRSTQLKAGRSILAITILAGLFAVTSATRISASEEEELVAAAEETMEWLQEQIDEAKATEEQLTTVATLVADIERAKTDPAALSGKNYADLFVRIVMLVPDSVELPSHISRTIGIAAAGIGALFDAATEMGLQDVRFRFRNHMNTLSGSQTERLLAASKLVSAVVQIQHWAILDWLGAQAAQNEIAWTQAAVGLRGRNGEFFDYYCPPRREQGVGTVWGTNTYTDDSSICAAAVHCGAITEAEGGAIRIEILRGQDSYTGTQRNGVSTQNWGPWSGSYRVIVSQPR